MSKLFSRTKSAATLKNSSTGNGGAFSDTDDFGRVKNIAIKRGKTESALQRSRQRTLSNPNLLNASSFSGPNRNADSYYERPDTPKELPFLPDGIFLQTNLAGDGGQATSDELHQYQFEARGGILDYKQLDYGYLSSERNVILGLDEVVRLVDVVADELGQRGRSHAAILRYR